MLTRAFATLTATGLALSSAPLAAQQAGSDVPPVAIVDGIAPGDLLNVREAASPTGKVIGRLDNGAILRTQGCDQVNGYRWCRVEAVDQADVRGWAPARYLHPASPEDIAAAQREVPPEAPVETAELETPNSPAQPEPAGASVPAPAADAAAAPRPEAAPVLPPPDLAARLGGAREEAAALDPQRDVIAMLEQDAAQAAVSLAFTGDDNPVTGEIFSPMLKTEPGAAKQEEAEPVRAPESPLPLAVTQARVQRLGRPVVAQAQLPTAASTSDAVGEVPCARYIGQPMNRCAASVARAGADAAEVTVALPDGGTRVIHFREGKPAGSNSRGEFRFTREGDLNMIRIGVAERFEIPDSLAFGD